MAKKKPVDAALLAPVPIRRAPTLVQVYDAARTARLNAKYYGRRLELLRRWSVAADVAVALGTSGAFLAALGKASAGGGGGGLVVFLTLVAAALAVVKPILAFTTRMERASQLWSGYCECFSALKRIVNDIAASEGLRDDMVPAYAAVMDRLDALDAVEDPWPNRQAMEKLQDEVNVEMPPTCFWMPPQAA